MIGHGINNLDYITHLGLSFFLLFAPKIINNNYTGKMVCSLAPIWCAKSAQGVLISKSSMANVLDVHSRVLSVNYRIISSTSDSAHWCVEYNDVMCYMLQAWQNTYCAEIVCCVLIQHNVC